MITFIRRLVACALLLVLAATCGAAEPVVVRLVTWNLKWFPGGSPSATPEQQEKHVAQVGAALAEMRPDVLILQEVRSPDDVAAALRAAGLPLEVHVCSRFKDAQRGLAGQQIAIASRHQAKAAWSAAWQRGWAGAPRGYAYAQIEIAGRTLNVYGLHLKSNLGGDAALNASKREDAVEQALEHASHQVKSTGSELVVIAGDFNTSFEGPGVESERTLKMLVERGYFWPFEGVPAADRVTIPSRGKYPDACFDHVFLRGLGRPVAWVAAGGDASDHRPVLVEVRIDPAPDSVSAGEGAAPPR